MTPCHPAGHSACTPRTLKDSSLTFRVTGWRASAALKMPALIVMPEIPNNNTSQPVSKVLLKKTNLLFKTKKLGNKKIRRVY